MLSFDERLREPLARFLAEERLPLTVDELWVDPRQRLTALCYVQTPRAILLLKRNKEPFRGYWTAPGGKVKEGETPAEAAVREMREETGLRIRRPSLRLIASELGPDPYCWLLFGFAVFEWCGEVGQTAEGELAWVARDELASTTLPEVDRYVLPYVLEEPRDQVYLARIVFGEGGRVEQCEMEPLPRNAGGGREGSGAKGEG